MSRRIENSSILAASTGPSSPSFPNGLKSETNRTEAEARAALRKSRRILYDTKCFELAEHFMPEDAPMALKDRLAQHIQQQIEEWLQAEGVEI